MLVLAVSCLAWFRLRAERVAGRKDKTADFFVVPVQARTATVTTIEDPLSISTLDSDQSVIQTRRLSLIRQVESRGFLKIQKISADSSIFILR